MFVEEIIYPTNQIDDNQSGYDQGGNTNQHNSSIKD